MAASTGSSKGAALSKADYLKRYMSRNEDSKKSKAKKVKKKRILQPGKGMKIVDDDVDWMQLDTNNEEKQKEDEDEDDEAPVVAEFIDERPEEVRLLEAFRTSNKWRTLGDDESVSVGESQESQDSFDNSNQKRLSSVNRQQHDSPEDSIPRGACHDSPGISPQRRARHDSPDLSPQRRARHDSPDVSLPRSNVRSGRHDSSSPSPPRSSHSKKSKGSSRDPDVSPPCRKGPKRRGSDSDQSPPRRCPQIGQGSDSDLSPPRKKRQGGRNSDSDLSPPRRRPQGGGGSDSDLSPPRRRASPDSQAPLMLSGGAAGLVSLEILRKEQEEIRRREKHNKPLEEESRNAQTVFRDKSGRKRNIDAERQEQSRKAGEKAEKDEKYAQWGKGLAQGQMQQQNVEDALREAQKPLARHRDDEDLDRMLREQERDGDPMAALLRKKKAKENKLKGIKEKPQYRGPAPPPNRFNIMPGYRWDGVDRSNGFEQKRYNRMADKKAVQDMAYKWSVEDM